MTILLKGVGGPAPTAGGLTGPGWDPAASSTDFVFTDSDRTATLSGSDSFENTLGLTSYTTGKKYFQVIFDVAAADAPAIGVANLDAFSVNNSFLGTGSSIAYYSGDGNVYNGGGSTAALSTYTAGDVLGCAIDFDAGKIWFSKNGVYASGDPSAGSGEHSTFTPGTLYFPASCLFTDPSECTGLFVTADFVNPAPSGFSEWG